MELSAASRQKRSQPVSRPAGKKSGGAPAPKQQASVTRLHGDRFTVSRQVLQVLEEQNRRAAELARRQAQAEEQGSEGEQKVKFLEKCLRILRNCQKIAGRITAGDKVPEEDLRYLMEHDPAGYRLAMAMRKPKKNPKEHDSILTDQDRAEEGGTISELTGEPRL